eukprot:364315-Chlamydomonas_euryale.AAC.4
MAEQKRRGARRHGDVFSGDEVRAAEGGARLRGVVGRGAGEGGSSHRVTPPLRLADCCATAADARAACSSCTSVPSCPRTCPHTCGRRGVRVERRRGRRRAAHQ